MSVDTQLPFDLPSVRRQRLTVDFTGGSQSSELLDQFDAMVMPGKREVLDNEDTFCAAHGGQQLRIGTRITTSVV